MPINTNNCRYVEENTRLSCSYKRYDLEMPHYLHNRPRHIVQHCLEKIDLAKSIPFHHVILEGEGQFEVHSQTSMLDVWCKVTFGGHDATPSCTCKEWQRTHLPCKHMFAIFRHKPDWGFENLSEAYRTSPFFILDEDLIFPNNNNNNTQPVIEFTKEERMAADSEEIDNLMNIDKGNRPLPSRFKKTVAAQCRELMNQAKSLTYIVDDTDILVQVGKSLKNCVKIMENSAPKASNGIILEQEGSSKPAPSMCAKSSAKEQTFAETFTSCNTQE